jgi:glycosyltransferase involved in cell wall biosynthesis
MPVYNGKRYLGQAIDSVLGQDFDDFELVIGDDGSGDGTVDLARAYGDRRVRVLAFGTNVGLAGNWNRTIQACRGRYIKYLAQDDLLFPGALRAFMNAAARFPDHHFFFCANEQIDEDGARLRFRRPSCPVGPRSPAQMLGMLLRGNPVGGPTNTLVRSEVFPEVGWFDPSCKYSLDWVMWVQIARRYGGVFLDESLVQVREHEESETRRLAKSGATWWDGYEALRVLRRREPTLRWWLNFARLVKLGSLPRYAVKAMLEEQTIPVGVVQHVRNVLRDGLWW